MRKRPILLLLFGYMAFLTVVLVLFPAAGGRIFGYEETEERCRQELETRDETLEFKVLKASKSASGWLLKTRVLRQSFDGCCTVFLRELGSIREGDLITAKGSISFPEAAANPGQRDSLEYARTEGVLFTFFPEEWEKVGTSYFLPNRYLGPFRRAMGEAVSRVFEEPYDGILQAMMLGESGAMDSESKSLFQEAGIAHLVAISGLHLSIVSEALEKLLSNLEQVRLPGTRRKVTLLSARGRRLAVIGFLWFYTILAGASYSTLRAALMTTFNQLAPLLHRRKDRISSCAASCLILLMKNPMCLFHSGFWLSYLAIVGIEIGMRLTLPLRFMPYPLRKYLASYVGVTLTTMPVSAWFFYSLGFHSFFMNLLVLPLSRSLLLSGIGGTLLGLIHPALGTGLAFLTTQGLKLCLWLGSVAEGSSFLKNLTLWGRPTVWQMGLYAMGMVILCMAAVEKERLKQSRMRLIGTLLILLLLLRPSLLPSWTPGCLKTALGGGNRITFLAVGQGDCAVIEWNGSVIVEDAGPAYEDVIEPYFKFRGLKKVDLLVLSHPDEDHIEGALLMAGEGLIHIDRLMVGQETEISENLAALETLVEEGGGTVLRAYAGDEFELNGVRLAVLSAQEAVETTAGEAAKRGQTGKAANSGQLGVAAHSGQTGKAAGIKAAASAEYTSTESTNDLSLVHLLIFPSGDRALFTGDAGKEAEKAALETLREDFPELYESRALSASARMVLKVGHHGSSTSSDGGTLAEWMIDVAVISCGKNNRYGHPHEETLETLETLNIPTYVTKDTGAVTVSLPQTAGGRRTIETYAKNSR